MGVHVHAVVEQLRAHARPALQCALPSDTNELCIMWAMTSLRTDHGLRLLNYRHVDSTDQHIRGVQSSNPLICTLGSTSAFYSRSNIAFANSELFTFLYLELPKSRTRDAKDRGDVPLERKRAAYAAAPMLMNLSI